MLLAKAAVGKLLRKRFEPQRPGLKDWHVIPENSFC
jgi:hypothetical protein